MTTPVADFVRKYAQGDVSRFHMPGHKGKIFLGCEALDITEINGADMLGAASGIIAESEENATSLFGSGHSFYSTEGSSLSIKTMLALIRKKTPANERTKILAARNAHKAFIYACGILDIDVEWIYPNEFLHLCSCEITPQDLENALKNSKALPHAVYITSPDYLGNVADVKGLAKVCRRHGLPLMVDNAHGAYLAFKEPSEHPLALGADMCCDSAHKTLPVLTGGAYLHISKDYKDFSIEEIRNTMSVFASTSPSYLILQSLDMCNAYITKGYSALLSKCMKKVRILKDKLLASGFPCNDTEELKLVFSKIKCGYSGVELSKHLSRFGIEIEFADSDYAVLMITPENSDSDLERIYNAFCCLKPKAPLGNDTPSLLTPPYCKMSIREAIFSNSEIIRIQDAEGRICATPTVSCPPAVPIVISGEVIDSNAIELMHYYGIEKIDVIK